MGNKHSKKKVQLEVMVTSVVKIQRWYRRFLAEQEHRRLSYWQQFQNFEHLKDAENIEIYKFYKAVINYMASKPGGAIGKRPPYFDERESLDTSTVTNFERIEKSQVYTGYVNKNNLGPSEIPKFIDWVTKKDFNAIHPAYVLNLLQQAIPKLHSQPNINYVKINENQRIIVLGKLAGHFDDLTMVFRRDGLPSNNLIYIFNGDIIGNGPRNIETLCLVLLAYLVWPTSVFLNRGCNEDSIMILRNGLVDQFKEKYREVQAVFIKKMSVLFRALPLATVVNHSVFIVHGGVTDRIDMKAIQNIERESFASILRPPMIDTFEALNDWHYLLSVMWTYPDTRFSLEERFPWKFDVNTISSFLEATDFGSLIRSREVATEHEETTFMDRVITICSSSNYYGPTSNKGCYFTADAMGQSHIVRYCSGRKYNDELTFRQSNILLEERILHILCLKLYKYRRPLEDAFIKYEKNQTGRISVRLFVKIIEEITKLKINFHILIKHSNYDAEKDKVSYIKALHHINDPKVAAEARKIKPLYKFILEDEKSLTTLFFLLDKQNHGFVQLSHFSDVCGFMKKYFSSPPNADAIYKRVASMDTNQDGYITYMEFCEAFNIFPKKGRRTHDLKQHYLN